MHCCSIVGEERRIVCAIRNRDRNNKQLVRLHRLEQKMSGVVISMHCICRRDNVRHRKKIVKTYRMDQRAHQPQREREREKSNSNELDALANKLHSKRENHEQQTFDISFNAICSHNCALFFFFGAFWASPLFRNRGSVCRFDNC